jgi:hypothetical protein
MQAREGEVLRRISSRKQLPAFVASGASVKIAGAFLKPKAAAARLTEEKS